MYKKVSYWEQDTFLKNIDLAVIGSGIVGVSAALTYKKKYPHRRVVVMERGVLPTGASTKNAGFACFGSISELLADMELYGEKQMLALVQKRWNGLKRLRSKVADTEMDYQEYGGYELFLTKEQAPPIAEYIPFFNERLANIIGVKDLYTLVDSPEQFGFDRSVILLKNKAEGQLHPGKMMRSLIQQAHHSGIQFFNGCEILDYEENATGVHLLTNTFDCQADNVLLATNGFTHRLLTDIDLQPARNQVVLTAPIPNLKIKGCFHFDEGYYYFRNIGNRLLLGGARNAAKVEETTDEFGTTDLIQDKLTDFLQTIILPQQSVHIDHVWSGILGVGPNKTPIVKKVSERIGMAVRLGGMGVAIGTLVGESGAELFF